jgi:GTPase Era involved in 16S rRNA processing
MDINTIRPEKVKIEKEVRKTDMNLVNQLLNDIVLYNDVANDFPTVSFWDRDRDLLKSLEIDARELLQKAVMVSNSNQPVRVAVVGNFSAGKSTFINSLIQDNICPVADKSTTSSVTTFSFAHKKAFYIMDSAGNKKEISVLDYEQMIQHGNDKTVRGAAQFFVEGPWDFVRDISLLDTPGFQRGEDAFSGDKVGGDDIVTENVIKKEADVLFWLMDINTGTISNDQKKRIERLKSETNNSVEIYVILNKADQKTSSSRQNILDGIKKEIGHLIKDVILYSSISKEKELFTINEAMNKVLMSVNHQCLYFRENWELKFSSSIGGRGGLKFHFHDNGNEISFIHKLNDDVEGRISERIEVQEMLKEIGSRNKELSYNHFDRELAAYKKTKENLIHISNKVEKRIDELWEYSFEPKLALFREELEAISKTFVKNNIGVFRNMSIDGDLNEILNSFMKLYSSTFNIFRKIVEEKFNYSIYEKELDLFRVEDLFLQQLIVFEDIEKAIDETTHFFNTNLYSAFLVHIQLGYEHLHEKYNNIHTKLR